MAGPYYKPTTVVILTILAILTAIVQTHAASVLARVPLGGSENDTAFRAAVTDDAIFIVGATGSPDFPLVNPLQSTFGGDPNGIGDMFIVKLDKSTREVLFATYLGGSGSDQANGVVVDLNGNILVSGWSDSTDFPVTSNAQQPQNAGKTDGIVVLLNPQLELIYASYLGGSQDDQFASIGVTQNTFLFDGSFVVVGFSNSTDYPTTAGLDGTCSSCGAGSPDAVVTAVNIDDGSVKWSQFLGGRTSSAPAGDVALDVKVLGSVIYVTGYTEDPDFPNRPFDTHKGGKDVFLTTFDVSDGGQRFSTTRGGDGDDIANGVDVGNGSNIFLVGSTSNGSNFPTSSSIPGFVGGATDAFLMRVNAEGGTVFPFTILMGGSGEDQARSIIFENFSRVHVGGVTSSIDLIVQEAIQDSFGGGGTDSFLYTFNVFTGLPEIATYLGGSGDEGITGGGLFNPNSLDEKKETLFVGGTSSNLGSNKAEDAEVTIVSPKPRKKFDLEVVEITADKNMLAYNDDILIRIKIRNNGPDESTGLLCGGDFPTVLYPGVENEVQFMVFGKKGSEDVDFLADLKTQGFDFTMENTMVILNSGEEVVIRIGVLFQDSNLHPNSFEIEILTQDENPANNKKILTVNTRGEDKNVGGTAIAEKQDTVGDPITSSNGAFLWNLPLVDLGGPAQLNCELIYRSDLNQIIPNTMLPHFWWTPFATLSARVPLNGKTYTAVQLPNGDIVSFKMSESGWVLVDNEEDVGFTTFTDNATPTPYVLIEQNNWFYMQDVAAEKIYLFEDYGSFTVLRFIVDRNGNRLNFTYDNGDGNAPTAVDDGLGRRLSFTYQGFGTGLHEYLKTVTDHGGRTWTLNYEQAGSDNHGLPTLRSVTDPLAQVTTINYASEPKQPNLIESIQKPNGNIPYRQTYDIVLNDGLGAVRVLEQTDAFDHKRTLAYDPALRSVTVTEPDSGVWRYESYGHHAPTKSIIDPNGKSLDFTRNERDQIISMNDREGQVWTFEYHPESGQLSRILNPLSQETSFTYEGNVTTLVNPVREEEIEFVFYDLVQVDHPDGSNETFEYDGHGNLTKRTDEGGHVTEYFYNSLSQRTNTVLSTGGEVFNAYDAAGNLISTNDSATAPTTYEYDALNRRVTIQLPDEAGDPGATRHIAYDAINRITSVTDEKGKLETYEYDANGNRTSIVDRSGNTVRFEYDVMDRLVGVTDREGAVTEYVHDSMGRLSQVDTPDQVARFFTYDTKGNLVAIREGENVATLDYDGNHRVTSFNGVLNRMDQFAYDAAGNRSGFVNTLNQIQSFIYDSRSHRIRTINHIGESTELEYDLRENLIRNVQIDTQGRLIRNARFHYNGNNELVRVIDANGQSWYLDRSPEGRLIRVRDPLQREILGQYDTQGRLSKVVRPDQTDVEFQYDVSGNLQRIHSTDGVSLEYSYDALDRLTATSQVSISRDRDGRIVGIDRFGFHILVNYDGAGRIESVEYPNQVFTVQYEYESSSGLLTRVSDSLSGGSVTFVYDEANRLIAMKRANDVQTQLTYDRADRLVRMQHGNSIVLDYSWDDASRIVSTIVDSPLLPDLETLGVALERFHYDHASQNTTSNYIYDAVGRRVSQPGVQFQWDVLDQMTKAGELEFSYDGFGHLISIESQNVITSYVRNDAIPAAPIVMETTGSNMEAVRYYVWTPDGRLVYFITPGDIPKVHYLHFDVVGSTMGLSTDDGVFSDLYTYTPFGITTARQGNSDQPFGFNGEYGVLQIAVGASHTFLKTAARFYDPNSASFLSREPMWSDLGNIGLLNPYQFALNNPARLLDPNGFKPTVAERLRSIDSLIEMYKNELEPLEIDDKADRESLLGYDEALARSGNPLLALLPISLQDAETEILDRKYKKHIEPLKDAIEKLEQERKRLEKLPLNKAIKQKLSTKLEQALQEIYNTQEDRSPFEEEDFIDLQDGDSVL